MIRHCLIGRCMCMAPDAHQLSSQPRRTTSFSYPSCGRRRKPRRKPRRAPARTAAQSHRSQWRPCCRSGLPCASHLLCCSVPDLSNGSFTGRGDPKRRHDCLLVVDRSTDYVCSVLPASHHLHPALRLVCRNMLCDSLVNIYPDPFQTAYQRSRVTWLPSPGAAERLQLPVGVVQNNPVVTAAAWTSQVTVSKLCFCSHADSCPAPHPHHLEPDRQRMPLGSGDEC